MLYCTCVQCPRSCNEIVVRFHDRVPDFENRPFGLRVIVVVENHHCGPSLYISMQVAPIYGDGLLVQMPTLAERLIVGEGKLVQWSLQQSANTGLGLTLLIEEVLDRADKLRQFCVTQENLDVVHDVAATLQSCNKLLAECVPLGSTVQYQCCQKRDLHAICVIRVVKAAAPQATA
jgi:hypothetical protein